MKRSRFTRIADYVPPLVAFVAGMAAIVGAPKWDAQASGLAKATAMGWTLFAIGLVALISSVWVTRRNHRDQAVQKALRARIAATGKDQILRGLNRMVCVFRESSYWQKIGEEPQSPLDLLTSERRTALSELNLNSQSPYFDGKNYPKWWEMFENTANEGASQIIKALQIYVTFLEPEVIEASTRLLNCEFQHRLQHIHSIVDANTMDDSSRSVRFFWVTPDERYDSGYKEYWELVSQLAAACSGDVSRTQTVWGKSTEQTGG